LFHRGDKVAQLVIQRVEYVGFERAVLIQGGERGSDGFGSTGR
jgi:dUTP pyrophosphatase